MYGASYLYNRGSVNRMPNWLFHNGVCSIVPVRTETEYYRIYYYNTQDRGLKTVEQKPEKIDK